jgi:aldehyde dehydrogenase (NAD+)
MTKEFKNFINNKWLDPISERYFESTNPADNSEVLGKFASSGTEDANLAINSAFDAFGSWSGLSQLQRGEFLQKASSWLEENSQNYADAITKECGKSIAEAKGEVGRSVALLRYYAAQASDPIGDVVPSVNPNILLYTTRSPLGVVGMITPWNFPLAIPIWKMAPALVFGNTVVHKPASSTPLLGSMIAAMWESVGLPNGVYNLVTGAGSELGDSIIDHPYTAALSFTGSTYVGKNVAIKCATNGMKYQLEMGGKNPVIIMPDANLEQAAEVTLSGAMKYSGQKCTATSRAIVSEEVKNEFNSILLDKLASMKIGNGMDPENLIVPVIDTKSLSNIENKIGQAVSEGGELMFGGKVLKNDSLKNGNFIQPALFGNVKPDSMIATEEVFGPVLALINSKNYEDSLSIANQTSYGLSAGIFTSNLNLAMDFANKINAGIVKINGETAGVEPQVPFGGMKESSSGAREQGKSAVDFFTQIKTVYVERSA